MKTIAILSFLLFILTYCGTNKPIVSDESRADAPVIVYKMKADYSQLVPVTLNSDKTQIVSYPDPSDLYFGGALALPTRLIKGYWLDNRGITPSSVFLKTSYSEYAGLKQVPSVEKLYAAIADSDPFLEMYDCGKRFDFQHLEKELKKIIRSNFTECKRIK